MEKPGNWVFNLPPRPWAWLCAPSLYIALPQSRNEAWFWRQRAESQGGPSTTVGQGLKLPPRLGIPVAWGHSLCLTGAAAGPPQGGKSPQRTVCAFEVYKLGLCIALNLFRFFCSSQIFLSYKAQGRHHGLCEAISKLPAFFFFSGPSLPMCKAVVHTLNSEFTATIHKVGQITRFPYVSLSV